jgi:diacylglycerol kinase family enzyme/membrane-associated phospholipid phosphatase
MPIDVRRAQPADRRPWVWGLGLPLVVLVLLTFAVATDWRPLLDLDRAIADRAYDLTAGHPLWLDSLRVLADVSTPTALCFLALLLAAVLLVRGHRRVAIWLTFVTALQLATAPTSKRLLERERPFWAEALDVAPGFSFPSGHAAAGGWFAACGVLLALMALPRGRLRRLVCTGLVLLGVIIGGHRVFIGVHFASDVVAGWALGVLVAMIGWALLLRVEAPVPGPVVGTATVRPMRLAVVLNPVKVTNPAGFRALVTESARVHGWIEPLWYETTIDDPGEGQAEAALAAGAEMVIAAGGDGTVRVVCSELARTGVPIGIVPLGTGNLLARNLGIPLNATEAVEVAMSGQDRAVDVVAFGGDGLQDSCFMVMAGLGLDAAIMQGAPAELKARMGWPAYVVSALRQLRYPAVTVEISIDGGPPLRSRARTVVIGNVGFLQGGIPLLPDASIDDGELDVVVIAPRRSLSWLPLVARVMSRGRRTDESLDRMTGRSVVVRAERTTPRQLDGDPVAPGREIHAQVLAGTLLVRVPRPLV